MRNLSVILVALAVQVAYGHYQGPFLLWGVDNLNDMKIPTLQGENFEEFLKLFNISRQSVGLLTIFQQLTTRTSEKFTQKLQQ